MESLLPDFVADPPAREGYMWKRSEHRRKWNKRWFVLWPAAARPGQGRMLYWFASKITGNLSGEEKKLKGSVKLVPGAFNVHTEDGRSKKERDFSLTMLIEVPDRDLVRLATDNEREAHSWIQAMQSRECSPNGDSSPQGMDLRQNLAQMQHRGFDAHSEAGGRASEALQRVRHGGKSAGEEEQHMRAALALLLPSGTDVSNSHGAELLIQAEHAAKARDRALANQDAAAAAIRSVDLLKQKLVAAESDRMAQQEVDQEALAEAQEVAAELRGENKLLQEDVAHYKQLAASHGDSSSTSPSRDPAQAQGGAMAAETADVRTMVSGAATAAVAMVEEGVPDLRPEVTRLSDRVAVLEAMLEEARTEGRTLRSTSRELRARLDAQSDSAGSQSERLSEMQAENTRLFSEGAEARAGLAQATAAAAAAEAAAKEVQARCATAQAQAEAATAAAAARVRNAEEATAAATAKAEQFEMKALATVRLEEEAAARKGELDELEMVVEDLSGEITELENKLGEEEGRREAAEAQVSELEEKLRNTIEMATERMRAMQTGSGAGGGRAKKR